ncbi:SDR family oxidoreductase [Streptomyces sp. NPDC002677]|uniref:SDR family oxidoreductase n=1 Tax=Streptomyces sp. NPDC002677 TaxID=3154774 RepID=UPI00331C8439
MEILNQPPSAEGPADMFDGDVWFDVISQGQEPSRARANMVRFAPGARTAWHSHGLGQTLYIVEGIALIQSRGGEILEARPGDVIYTPPGEAHWHRAASGHFMSHDDTHTALARISMKHELRQMRTQGSGVIVNCSSMGGLLGMPQRAAHHASKHGVIDTPMAADMVENQADAMAEIMKEQSIGRQGRADEIAAAVLWLCSPGAGLVVGVALPVDGGFTAH